MITIKVSKTSQSGKRVEAEACIDPVDIEMAIDQKFILFHAYEQASMAVDAKIKELDKEYESKTD